MAGYASLAFTGPAGIQLGGELAYGSPDQDRVDQALQAHPAAAADKSSFGDGTVAGREEKFGSACAQ